MSDSIARSQGATRMHMADALISPAVGGTMWAATAGTVGWCCRRVKTALPEKAVPLMGVMAAFTFAAQMINFAIPGTGSSGHLGGGVLLAVLLGPYAALLTMVSVLTVQAVFFADGGLLALGCNIFNLGLIPCLIAYPLVYRPLVAGNDSIRRKSIAAVVAAVVALQLGSLAVVLQTALSGISSLPVGTFALMMQPIHLAIGLVEGLATAAVVRFAAESRPDLLANTAPQSDLQLQHRAAPILAAIALVLAGAVSWFASTRPDGLEWAVEHSSQKMSESSEASAAAASISKSHRAAAAVQAETAVLPDYNFKSAASPPEDSWPSVSAGTSAAGITGGILTLFFAVAAGWLLRRKRRTVDE